ncbi:MAG TPA: FAD-dependent oxidoreductase [Tepidisphaeraceae bacterium]
MSRSVRTIVIVGSGIQGLMTALALRGDNARITVHSAGRDPRTPGDARASTTNGEAGRFITPLEGHPYLGDGPMYPDMAGAFTRRATEGGWLGDDVPSYSESEQAWLRARHAANHDAAGLAVTADWFAQTSLDAMDRWRELFDSHASLFVGTSLIRDAGVLCLYDQPHLVNLAADAHHRLGTLQATLDAAALADEAPELATACRTGTIAGGLRVTGYSLDVKRLTLNLINALEATGVRFVWSNECTAVNRDGQNRVASLQFTRGRVTADDYVLHPGAYAGAALSAAFGLKISGVAGRWLLLPRPLGLPCPVKVHFSPRETRQGTHAVMDLNLTPYIDPQRDREYLAIGGGYLHVGDYPFRYDDVERRHLDDEIATAVRRLLPDWFARCEADGSVVRSDATCVRALTPDDRPAVICEPTAHGGHLLLHAGLNTGVTAMAPAIAHHIACLLRTGEAKHAEALRPPKVESHNKIAVCPVRRTQCLASGTQ